MLLERLGAGRVIGYSISAGLVADWERSRLDAQIVCRFGTGWMQIVGRLTADLFGSEWVQLGFRFCERYKNKLTWSTYTISQMLRWVKISINFPRRVLSIAIIEKVSEIIPF